MDETLACPACRGPLVDAAGGYECDGCGLSYPAESGLPILLPPGSSPSRDAQARIHDGLSRAHNARKLSIYWETGFHYIFNLLMAKHARMLARLAPPRGGRHLDVGCQDGMILSQVVRRFGVRGTGVDVSEESLRLALARNDLGIHYYLADALSLPFRDGAFDTVHSLGTMEHITDHPRYISEMARVLRPGGRLLVDMINRRDALTVHGIERWLAERRGRAAAARQAAARIGHDHDTFREESDLRGMCESAGLRVRRVSHYNAIVPLLFDTRVPRLLARLRRRPVDFMGRPFLPGDTQAGPSLEPAAGAGAAAPRNPGPAGLAIRRAASIGLKGLLPVAELLDSPLTSLGYGNSFYVLAERT